MKNSPTQLQGANLACRPLPRNPLQYQDLNFLNNRSCPRNPPIPENQLGFLTNNPPVYFGNSVAPGNLGYVDSRPSELFNDPAIIQATPFQNPHVAANPSYDRGATNLRGQGRSNRRMNRRLKDQHRTRARRALPIIEETADSDDNLASMKFSGHFVAGRPIAIAELLSFHHSPESGRDPITANHNHSSDYPNSRQTAYPNSHYTNGVRNPKLYIMPHYLKRSIPDPTPLSPDQLSGVQYGLNQTIGGGLGYGWTWTPPEPVADGILPPLARHIIPGGSEENKSSNPARGQIVQSAQVGAKTTIAQETGREWTERERETSHPHSFGAGVGQTQMEDVPWRSLAVVALPPASPPPESAIKATAQRAKNRRKAEFRA
ncbi:hypothetical protein K469DRAFT_157718 [Zopfia rhizophila CBS 207.26]|uniref:Uncharacterized protein n=1 Tax=Zopfia rhizophila CBS 207.26 TaxID=1314779 RepID=A0A6A6E6Q3_9PEZI|nr:hypothetical protein K469DRAFT_157718 [Zopfia rhizophila CBS 207.26]